MIARRRLGATGFSVPMLGLGVSGPHGLGLAPTDTLVAMACDAGAAFFDTAPFYGDAEARLGAALKGRPRDTFQLCTKVGTHRVGRRVRKDFTPHGVAASVAASLAALGVAEVELLLLHGPSDADLTDDLADALHTLQKQGRVRSVGICTRGPEVETALAWPPCAVIQAPVWERATNAQAGASWAQRAAEVGKGFLAIEALRGAAPAWRFPKSPADLWYLARAVVQRAPAPDGGDPLQRLRDAIAVPGVSSVTVTTTRPAHWAANLAVAAV